VPEVTLITLGAAVMVVITAHSPRKWTTLKLSVLPCRSNLGTTFVTLPTLELISWADGSNFKSRFPSQVSNFLPEYAEAIVLLYACSCLDITLVVLGTAMPAI
jgi:hypothetical protein